MLGLAMGVGLPVAHAQAPKPTTPMPAPQTIHDAAIAEVLRFYVSFGNTIETSHWRVSIEDFEWQDAVYRIDVAVDEYPTLVPWKSAYVMAHRIWMTAAGRPVKSEPIYDRPNLAEGAQADSLPAHLRGFYPGSAHFATQLAFVNTALQNAEAVTVTMEGAHPGIVANYPFPKGIQDLASTRAEVLETESGYQIRTRPPGNKSGPQLRFHIHKDSGKISGARLMLLTPPALM